MKTTSINDKLELILKNQETILKNEKKILAKEDKIEDLEEVEIKEERQQFDAIEELTKLENELKTTMTNPMQNVTKRDIVKGMIGAFIGVMSHFAFSKAVDIANELSIGRATILYIVAFAIIVLMLYYTGFRNIQKKIVLKFMPLRATVLYSVSIIAIIIINLLFGKIHFPISFVEVYTLVGASIILAVMGAGTADLIGRNE